MQGIPWGRTLHFVHFPFSLFLSGCSMPEAVDCRGDFCRAHSWPSLPGHLDQSPD